VIKSLTEESLESALNILREAAKQLASIGVMASVVTLPNREDGGLGIALFMGCDVSSTSQQETISIQNDAAKMPFDLITIEQNNNETSVNYSWKGEVLCTQELAASTFRFDSIILLENIEGHIKIPI
jgi:hypothetical protein